MILRFVASLAILLGLTVFPALAEKRVALVLGNGAYTAVPELLNPSRDADAIALMLADLGFEVIVQKDADRSGMNAAMGNFVRALDGADVGLFYYAGHGIQYEGRNYLIGTTATADNQFSLTGGSLALDEVITAMEAVTRTNIIFLDACRENPFVDDLKKTLPATRSTLTSDGLAPVKTQQGKDTMIVYATAANNVAEDGEGTHSPFATALLTHMVEPDVEVSLMVKRVIQSVRDATAYQQNPEILSAMAAEFYFKRGPAAATPATAPVDWPVVETATESATDTIPVIEVPGTEGAYDRQQLATLLSDPLEELATTKTLSPEEVEVALRLTKDDVKVIQTALNDMGYDLGTADGSFGKKSRDALKEFQNSKRVEQTGYLSKDTIDAVIAAFQAAPKTYDGRWKLEIRRKIVGYWEGNTGKIGDRQLIAIVYLNNEGGIFTIDRYDVKTLMPDEPFQDFRASLSTDGTLSLRGLVSVMFPDPQTKTAVSEALDMSVKLPKYVTLDKVIVKEGNRFHMEWAFEVTLDRLPS